MEWQPIETAPNGGVKILLFCPSAEYKEPWKKDEPPKLSTERVGEGLWVDDEWRWANDSCGCCWTGIWPVQPTHWMPLPEPPSEPIG